MKEKEKEGREKGEISALNNSPLILFKLIKFPLFWTEETDKSDASRIIQVLRQSCRLQLQKLNKKFALKLV